MTILALTPNDAVTIGSGWILAFFALLTTFATALGVFWARFGTQIQAILARLDRHGARLDSVESNAIPPALIPQVLAAAPIPPPAETAALEANTAATKANTAALADVPPSFVPPVTEPTNPPQ